MADLTHSDLASLSAAHERDPEDKEVLGKLNAAYCRVFGHMHAGLYVGKITDEGKLGSYCALHKRGCPVCSRCNQVACEHRDLFDPRPLGLGTLYHHGLRE